MFLHNRLPGLRLVFGLTVAFIAVVPGASDLLAEPAADAAAKLEATKSETAESASTAAAELIIGPTVRMDPLSEEKGWRQVPEFLKGATISFKRVHLDPKKTNSNEVRVEKAGVVLVAATRRPNSNLTVEDDRSALARVGWVAVGEFLYREHGQVHELTLFRRTVPAGAPLNFTCKSYHPPHLVKIDEQQAATAAKLKPGRLHQHDLADLARLPVSLAKGTSAKPNLLLLEMNNTFRDSRGSTSLLERELVRQALLLSAREEFGLPTRDHCLREEFPSEGDVSVSPWQVAISRRYPPHLDVTIFRMTADGIPMRLWEQRVQFGYEASLEGLTTQIERRTRDELAQVLAKQGYTRRQAPEKIAETSLPNKLENRLNEFNFIAQLAAARELHTLLASEGESATELAALARVYAQLGNLTECLWTPANKAFKARALLYAERLVARDGDRPEGFWARGFVRGLLGLHASAIADLDQAEKLAAKLDDKNRPTAPAWAAAIRAHCEFDSKKLAEAEKDETIRPLVRYLQMLQIEFSQLSRVQTRVIGRLLEVAPDCLRAMDLLFKNGELGIVRMAGSQAFPVFENSLYRRLQEVPGLPEEIRELCRSAVESAKDSDADEEGDVLLATRQKLVARLEELSATQPDQGEPSLNLVARLIREMTFLHCWRLIWVQHYQLGAPSDEIVDSLLPLVENHPYAQFLASHGTNPDRNLEVLQALGKSLQVAGLEPTEDRLMRSLHPLTGKFLFMSFYSPVYARPDRAYQELATVIEKTRSFRDVRSKLKMLGEISPHAPLVVMAEIAASDKQIDEKGAGWEQKFNDDAEVLGVLAAAYIKRKRMTDAERCLERACTLSPDLENFDQLAKLHRMQGDMEKWKSTLERFLEGESLGLEHARVQVQLAEYHMGRLEWNDALPYADAAADTYSAWGMECASRCYEGLEDWDKSERYVRQTSQRYENSSFDWYWWCRRTGRGDLRAAEQYGQQFIDRYAGELPGYLREGAGVFELLRGHEEEALEHFTVAMERTKSPWNGLQGAIVAQKLGDTAARDRLLQQAIKLGGKYKDNSGRVRKELLALAGLMQKACKDSQVPKLDEAACEKLTQATPPGERTNVQYFVGAFLLVAGEETAGVKYLQLAATASGRQTTRSQAAAILRDRKIEVGPRRVKDE